MDNKVFQIIENDIKTVLLKNGFTQNKLDQPLYALFSNGDVIYKLCYDAGKKTVNLLLGADDQDDRIVSSWLFDPDFDTEKEAKSIAADFVETLEGVRKKHTKKTPKKKSDDERNVDTLFMINRLASIFPDLKNEILVEKQSFESFRALTFAREKALPYVLDTLLSATPKEKFSKLCDTFSSLYSVGNLDVRSIITVVFLNAVDDQQAISRIEDAISEDLKKAYAASRRMKHKKFKPEIRKKQKTSLLTQALRA